MTSTVTSISSRKSSSGTRRKKNNAPQVEFPAKLEGLFRPARYKVLYGGRGAAKSWGVARALLIEAASRPLRVLCAREFQNSIRDSVHKLLSEQIVTLGLEPLYEVKERSIRARNGSEFIFEGLRHNITKIKSLEGIDRAWVEEAQTVSFRSWETLIPTVRKEGSEIWVTFNPELESDETYQRFVVTPPANAWVQEITWRDNPWFPDVLDQERCALQERNPDAYLNVWEGKCRQALDGAVYAKELREAQMAARLTKVPYDRTQPVHTFWDLGWADSTAIWFAQVIGFEYRVIRYLESSQQPLAHYLQEMQSLGYVYGDCWLPHDARAKQLGTGRSIEEMVRSAGFRARIVPQLSVADGINAARTLFPQLWFDREGCADGLQALRHYRYDTEHPKREPVHDWSSHAADALRYLAVALRAEKPRPKIAPPPKFIVGAPGTGWLAT